MPGLGRSNPHLRLTAAILVAMLAALAGSFDREGTERTRRSELHTLVGGLRLVSVPDDRGQAHLVADLRAVRADEARSLVVEGPVLRTADARAAMRGRLDRSRASGAALLRTTALPPPVA